MSKLGADGKPIYREDGKVLKGPNYFKPDIEKSLKKLINFNCPIVRIFDLIILYRYEFFFRFLTKSAFFGKLYEKSL